MRGRTEGELLVALPIPASFLDAQSQSLVAPPLVLCCKAYEWVGMRSRVDAGITDSKQHSIPHRVLSCELGGSNPN